MITVLLAVVASATTALGVVHVKWSLDGTYVRWASEAQAKTVSTEGRNRTERDQS